MRKVLRAAAALAAAALVASACGDDDDDPSTATPGDPGEQRVTLVTYDSFPEADTGLNDALAAFSAETGIAVELAVAGDAGTMVSKAVLTAGNPEGDVMFGIDNTFLSRAVDGDVFEPYEAAGLEAVPEALRALVPEHHATPVDFGDVCVNYDIAWFSERALDPPADLAALAEPEYQDLLVVENPASSSPGMAFVLATIAEFGTEGDPAGWVDFWSRLRANGVRVVDSWTEAYYEQFSWAGGGDRPLVVSYGSSPPAEVIFADPPVDAPPTAAIESTCFRQVEFAGVLAGTDAREAARALVDFMISERFQSELALTLFVYPAHGGVELPAEYTDTATVADDPYELEPAEITAGREGWIETWTDTVLR